MEKTCLEKLPSHVRIDGRMWQLDKMMKKKFAEYMGMLEESELSKYLYADTKTAIFERNETIESKHVRASRIASIENRNKRRNGTF